MLKKNYKLSVSVLFYLLQQFPNCLDFCSFHSWT